jgi:MFS family permease
MQTDPGQQSIASTPERHLFINRNFARPLAGETLSGPGDAIFETTLVVWIASDLAKGYSWSALAVSALLVASTIPILVVGPIAGALVDRWPDKRQVLLRTDIVIAVLILALLPAAGIISPCPSRVQPRCRWRGGSDRYFWLFSWRAPSPNFSGRPGRSFCATSCRTKIARGQLGSIRLRRV